MKSIHFIPVSVMSPLTYERKKSTSNREQQNISGVLHCKIPCAVGTVFHKLYTVWREGALIFDSEWWWSTHIKLFKYLCKKCCMCVTLQWKEEECSNSLFPVSPLMNIPNVVCVIWSQPKLCMHLVYYLNDLNKQ